MSLLGRAGLEGPRVFLLLACMALVTQTICGCDYARMREDEALQTYQAVFPVMPKETIPVTGGIEVLAASNPESLVNPIPPSPETVETGRESYGFYCIQCHGPAADGKATVGQSFVPLPTNLKLPYVQSQSDGMLFYKISLGFLRHPPLAETVAEKRRWAVINFIRFLGAKS